MYESDLKEIKKAIEFLITSINQPKNIPPENKLDETQSNPEIEQINVPMEINRILQKPATDVVTINCRIYGLKIPSAVIDSGANCCIMSKNIAKKLGLNIDTNKAIALEGVATENEAIGWVYDVPVSIGFFTLVDDFIVVDDNKPALLLGTPWLDRAHSKIDFDNRVLYIRNSADLTFNVPISVHKYKDKKKP